MLGVGELLQLDLGAVLVVGADLALVLAARAGRA